MMTTFADGSLADLASRHESVSSLMQSYDAACIRAEAAEARAADLAEANREQSETIDILRAELAQLRSSFVTLKARCDELTEMAIGRDAEIERLHIELEATAAAYKIGNDELKRIIETLRTERNEAWSSLKDARDTIQDLTL